MSKYKGVIFDLDGTLLNTIDDIHDAMNFSLIKNGLSEISRSNVLSSLGNGVFKLVENVIGFFGKNKDFDIELYQNILNDYNEKYQECRTNKTCPFDHVLDVLNFLKNDGIKLGVLSNKSNDDVCDIISKFFPNIFDVVCGAKEGFLTKPDPTLALQIAVEFGLENEEILFVGDSNVDIFTAKNAGFDSVAALYGYRTEKELRECKPTYLIKTPKGLLKYFRKEINGILLIDKPIGCTSHDVVSRIKSVMNIEKVGHAGTLDPFASGLLVLLLGSATKLSDYLLEENKEYIATVVLGKTTNTLDCEGLITNVKNVDENLDVDDVLKNLIGKIKLVPPVYSAIKLNGRKMYDLARKGENIEISARENVIFMLKRLNEIKYEDNCAYFDIVCSVSKGTYIRSLAKKIGDELGYPAYLTALRRIKCGQMEINDAINLSEVNQKTSVISIVDALKGKKIVYIDDVIYNRVKNGMKVYLKNTNDEKVFLVYNNNLVAIYEKAENNCDCQYVARRVWK